jgi:hypothetical protein
VTVFSLAFKPQEKGRSYSIEDGITIDSADPIAQTSERPSKSTSNSFQTLNETDPSSISIERIPLPTNALSPIAVTEAGRKSRVSDEQIANVPTSIVATLDGCSNVADSRDRQKYKQYDPRRSTKEGIAIDRREGQRENASEPIPRR